MKKLFFLIAFLLPMIGFAQSFDSLWKSVEAAQAEDLPKTVQQTLRKIAVKAEKEKAYGQLLKAELMEAQSLAVVSSDSLKPAVDRLKQREQKLNDPVLRAVYQAVIGIIYQENPSFDERAREKANYYFDLALQHPEQLAAVKSADYKPLVTEGRDSRIYDGDLLSLIGYEAKRFDVLRDYYVKTSNRQAALMSSLGWLSQQKPSGMEKLNESAWLARMDSLISEYADLPEAGEAAIERYIYMNIHTDATPQQKWEYIDMALQRWGSWNRMNYLRNQRNYLKQLQFSVESDGVLLPHRPFTIRLRNMRGVSALTMRVYQVKAKARELGAVSLRDDSDYKKVKRLLKAMPELTQTCQYEGKAPYESYEDSLTLPALPVGIYMLEFESSPKSDNLERALLYVSDLRVMSQKLPNERMRYVVVNATTGQPVEGARLSVKIRSDIHTLTADAKGECECRTDGMRPSELYAYTDDDNASPNVRSYNYFNLYNGGMQRTQVEIFTDRAVYRPGQTVHMSAILYQTENGFQNTVLKNKKVTARLYDANHEEVAQQTLTTDDFGTCSADFTLPRQGLTGHFSLDVNGRLKYFNVEEYKRPTFEVDIPTVKENYVDGDTLQVKGTARTYAGVPVQGATVRYTVERVRAFWWWSYSHYWNTGYIGEASQDDQLASGETVTDADGSFVVPMPMIVPKTRYPMFYNFVVKTEVTDQAGETHHGEMSLPLGNRKTAFSVDVPEKVLSEKGAKMTFHLRNAAGNDIDARLRYRIDNGKWKEMSTNEVTDVPSLKSGKHLLEAVCGEDTVKQDFVVFSLDDRRPATETDDWFFVSADRFPNDGLPVTVQVGSSDNHVHIVYTILSGDNIVEQGSVDRSNELLNRKFTYQASYGNGLLITFAWVKNGIFHQREATISRPVPDSNLKLQWQTFRNRLVPGQQEEWTLVVKGPDGKPANAQLMATLYDKSLDQLVAHDWSLKPYLSLPMPRSPWLCATWGLMYPFTGILSVMRLNEDVLLFDEFDHSVFPVYYRAGFRGRRMVRSASMSDRVLKVAENVVEDAGSEMDESVNQTLQSRIVGMDVKTQANALPMQADVSVSSEENAPQVRENLNETAFFYPQLVADSTGTVVMKFTLPESLTTWRFMGLAHTQDMKTGVLTGEAVAKKDVMIQPNLPRFIREGDQASVSARVFNTSGNTVNGKVRLELLDPESMQVVYAGEQAVEVAPNSTTTSRLPLGYPKLTPSLLVVRMSVVGESFSDGEQHYLPILPNKERVTKTVPFTQYEPGMKTVNLDTLRGSGHHATLTVEYTNNPAWFMIQALPTVGHPQDNCAVCQTSSYYANAIGRYLMQQIPQAKNVFEAWSRDGSSLNSSLQKNQELKDLLLGETPWVADANSEQEQKERLADFFDGNLMQQRISNSLERLKALQLSDGSWSWWPGMKGSMYMTVEISEMLVRLNQMVSPQKETKGMLDSAFEFMGKDIVRMVDEMKKQSKKGWTPTFPSHMALQWLYICTLDGRKLPSDVQSANAYLIKLLKKEKRNQTMYDKAMSAIVLNNKTYIQSLKEYTVYSEEMGRYYDTQRAFYSWRDFRIPTQVAAIEAIQRLTPEDTQTIEEMQRWLLQEKRNQAWDTPINSVDAVYAFLNDGGKVNSEKLVTAVPAVLKVDGQEIETSAATAGIGYVKTAMPGDDKQTFTVEKTSAGTSWGAVYMQFMQHTSDIEAQSSGISVKREILQNNRNTQTSNTLKVGDRITVRITIEADRDYDFVQVIDKRAACMEPVHQLSGYQWGYYTTPKDCSTNYYFDQLSKGKHTIETEYYIDRTGIYETGTCNVSCAYSPEFRGVAKSQTIVVE